MRKTLGVVGGIAPESTVEYYRLLVRLWRARTGDDSYPKIIINSIDLTAMLRFVYASDFAGLTAFLLAELERLARAGAEVALFASNTPHLVYDDVAPRSPLPLISIVDTAAERAASLGLTRVGLFGTGFTMRAPFYPAVFGRRGITVVPPPEDDLAFVHDKYMNELVQGVFTPGTREAIAAIARRLRDSAAVEAIILGGTELPLLFRGAGDVGLPLLDTALIHAERAIEAMLA